MDNRGRQIFYVIGGGYLLYLAYKLLTTVKNQEGDNPVLLLIFGIGFGIAGIGILIYTYKMYKNEAAAGQQEKDKEESTKEEQAAEDNKNEK